MSEIASLLFITLDEPFYLVNNITDCQVTIKPWSTVHQQANTVPVRTRQNAFQIYDIFLWS